MQCSTALLSVPTGYPHSAFLFFVWKFKKVGVAYTPTAGLLRLNRTLEDPQGAVESAEILPGWLL